MYLGHIGIGLVAKRTQPKVPLWLILFASQAPDWFESAYRLAGQTDPGELSHGYPVVLIEGTLICLLAILLTRSRRATALIAAVFVSHIVVDLVTGWKPYWPNGPRLGLNWYAQPLWDFVAESMVLLGGWLLYRNTLSPAARGHFSGYLMLTLLLMGQAIYDWQLMFVRAANYFNRLP